MTKTVELHVGENVIELQMTPKLMESIKTAYGLLLDQDVTENHVKHYLTHGMRNALEVMDDAGAT